MNVRCCLVFVVVVLCASAASAQQPGPATQASDNTIHLDVVVTAKSGSRVSGLQQQDFTVLDNKVPRAIASFQEVDGRQAPVEVIVLIDAVNAPYSVVSYERDQIDKFLRSEGGDLAYPTALAVLTDTGLEMAGDFSKDGNVAGAALDKYTVSLGFLQRASGFYGATERFQTSLEGLHDLVEREAARPGRKLILCVSPGWPLLSGPEVQLDTKEQQQIFADIVHFSTDLLRARITLYCINPWGPNEAVSRETYWESFVKGISKPSQVNLGNLAVQVLATQSGGAVFIASNDVTASLRNSLADTRSYYEISFDAPVDDRSDEYHRLEVRVAKPGLTARSRQGYYSGASSGWAKLPKPVDTGNR
jgi:VWFA-related protein